MTFLDLLRPHRRRILAVGACLVLANGLALAVPWVIKILIDDTLPRRDLFGLQGMAVLLAGILGARALLSAVRQYQCAMMGERITSRLREQLFSRALRMELDRFRRTGPAQIHTRLTGDLTGLRRFLFGEAVEFLYAVLSLALLAGAMIVIDPRMAAIALAGLPVFLIVYTRIYPRLRDTHRSMRRQWGAVSARCAEALNAMTTVRALNGRPAEEDRLRAGHGGLLAAAADVQRHHAGLWLCVEVFAAVCTVGVLYLGGAQVIRGRMTAGELVAFYSYLGMLLAPLTRLIVIQGSYQEAAASLERINEVLTAPVEEHAEPAPVPGPPLRGDISFGGVSFGYVRGRPVLEDIRFDIPAGETVGIVGVSGAGKTTLVHLLLGFYRPWTGEVCLDGRPLAAWDPAQCRRDIAVVLQDDVLFSGTVRENISYGLGPVAPEAVEQAARLACAHDFITRLPHGYETCLDERGGGLSSGQRQRIAIARALIRRPSVLVLDEATAAVDALTENRIQQAVCEHMRKRTVIIIAHRFSTLAGADRIIVLDAGRVAAAGGHNYLLNNNAIYSSLYREQFRESQTLVPGDGSL